MKRALSLFLLLALILVGCSPKYTVDTENQTISDGKHTYTYTDRTTTNDRGTFRTVAITYPNGGMYYRYESRTPTGFSVTYNETGNYDPVEYAYGEDLMELLVPDEEEPVKTTRRREYKFNLQYFIGGLILLVLGGWQYEKPELFWRGRVHWWVKNGEPTDHAVQHHRNLGVLWFIVGIFAILLSIFGSF